MSLFPGTRAAAAEALSINFKRALGAQLVAEVASGLLATLKKTIPLP
jgi:hypothetical protein